MTLMERKPTMDLVGRTEPTRTSRNLCKHTSSRSVVGKRAKKSRPLQETLSGGKIRVVSEWYADHLIFIIL